jgi:superfamily I DNA/RNA helicase
MVRAYEEILLRNGKIDFQDLVLRALRGMEQGRIAPLAAAHLLVDEFQDTDESQLAWVLAHARAGVEVTAVGDDDQSIYGWRRALGHQGMERFAQALHARRIGLGINYRSRREIVQQAAILIARNRGRARQNKSRAGAAVLTTMHGAKGLEWDCVWIVGAEETVTPDGKAPLEEERRLFYVAMTRAREALFISHTNRNPPSRFLSELGPALQ